MAASCNPRVAQGISGLFGQRESADCQLVFLLDSSPLGISSAVLASAAGGDRKRARAAVCGEPLPAHSFVLRFASDKIAAQLNWPSEAVTGSTTTSPRVRKPAAKREARTSAAAAPPAAAPAEQQLPEVELFLDGEDELPAALAAVKFGYTGRVEAGSIRAALQVRRQAAYLQMEGCVEACLAAVREKLLAAGDEAAAAAAGSGTGTSTAGGSIGTAGAAGARTIPVLELYSCAALWPDAAEDAAFAELLAEAKRRLVAHFGDALAVLNGKELYEQMRALPAVGMEVLLESDDFGTDDESSVVLMLAEWITANHSGTDEATRRRLCGLLRLVQCSRAYLSSVLPVLAARHRCNPTSAAGWFPMSPAEAVRLQTYSTASEAERKAMVGEGRVWGPCGGMQDWPASWRSTQPRRQCLPPEGRTFAVSATLADLKGAFGHLKPDEKGALFLNVSSSRHADCIVAQGLEWRPYLSWDFGAATAGVFLTPHVPAALSTANAARGGEVAVTAEEDLLSGAVVACPRLRLSVCGADGQQAWSRVFGAHTFVRMGCSWGCPQALKLQATAADPQPAGAAGAAAGQGSSSGVVAARWAPYLQDGGTRLEGSMKLLPPARG